MKYYFEEGKDVVYVKADSLEEHDKLLSIVYVYKNKAKDTFAVKLPYLVNLNRKFTLEPATQKDKEILYANIKKTRYIASLSEKQTYTKFDYNSYLRLTDDFKGLYDFQKVGVRFITLAKKCILADDVGLGKTLMTIASLCHLIKKKKINESIIIVTLASVKYQWKSQIEEFVEAKRNKGLPNNYSCIADEGIRMLCTYECRSCSYGVRI